jgi:hypothetical protein
MLTPDEKPPKTIDQRLEALAQSVELLAAMQLKTEKQIRRLGRYIRMIVLDHESRLLALEDGDEDGDGQKNADGH